MNGLHPKSLAWVFGQRLVYDLLCFAILSLISVQLLDSKDDILRVVMLLQALSEDFQRHVRLMELLIIDSGQKYIEELVFGCLDPLGEQSD